MGYPFDFNSNTKHVMVAIFVLSLLSEQSIAADDEIIAFKAVKHLTLGWFSVVIAVFVPKEFVKNKKS